MIAWIDVEGVWEENWSKKFLRIDSDSLLLSRPETGEHACDIAEGLLRSGAVDIIAIDSIAMMTPMEEIEKSASESSMATQARLLGKHFRKITMGLNSLANREGRKPSVWFINQVRTDVGVMFGNPEVTPGGRAQGFTMSTETRMSAGKYIRDKESGQPTSVVMKYRNEKNKTWVAKMEGEYSVCLCDTEVKKLGQVIDEPYALKLGSQLGLVDVGRGRASYNGVDYAGRSLLERHWMLHPDEYEDYKAALMALIIERGGVMYANSEEELSG